MIKMQSKLYVPHAEGKYLVGQVVHLAGEQNQNRFVIRRMFLPSTRLYSLNRITPYILILINWISIPKRIQLMATERVTLKDRDLRFCVFPRSSPGSAKRLP